MATGHWGALLLDCSRRFLFVWRSPRVGRGAHSTVHHLVPVGHGLHELWVVVGRISLRATGRGSPVVGGHGVPPGSWPILRPRPGPPLVRLWTRLWGARIALGTPRSLPVHPRSLPRVVGVGDPPVVGARPAPLGTWVAPWSLMRRSGDRRSLVVVTPYMPLLISRTHISRRAPLVRSGPWSWPT